jgi:hypothetical protein
VPDVRADRRVSTVDDLLGRLGRFLDDDLPLDCRRLTVDYSRTVGVDTGQRSIQSSSSHRPIA